MSQILVLVPASNALIGNGLFNRPSSINSVADGFSGYTAVFAPLLERFGFSKGCYSAVAAAVVLLFLLGYPSAVTRLIISGEVNSINGMRAAGLIPHVRKEVFEREPAVTDFDSFSPVLVVPGALRVEASGLHVYPAVINSGFGKPVRASINTHGSMNIDIEASA